MADPQTAYREAAVQGASPVRQVVMLYEQVIEDLRRAGKALDENNIEARTREINHAVAVIGFLQGKLNMEQGGQVARNLEQFYNSLRAQLVKAQCQASREILSQLINDLLSLREAWVEVEKVEAASGAPQPVRLTAEGDGASSRPKSRTNWEG